MVRKNVYTCVSQGGNYLIYSATNEYGSKIYTGLYFKNDTDAQTACSRLNTGEKTIEEYR